MNKSLWCVALVMLCTVRVAHAAENATLTALAPGFDYANGELKAAKASEQSAPQVASQKYLVAAQYADGLLASIEPLQKAGHLKLDGTVATKSAGTLSAKDFLAKLKAISKDGKAGVDRLSAKVKALDKQQADAEQKTRTDALAKREKAQADLLAHPPADYAKFSVSNELKEPVCEVTTVSQGRGRKRIQYLKDKSPLKPGKALTFPLAPGKHSLFVGACGGANKRRVGAIAVTANVRDAFDVAITPRAKDAKALEWKVRRTPGTPPVAKQKTSTGAARPSAPSGGYVAPVYNEEPQVVSASEVANDAAPVEEAPPVEVEEPEPEPAAPAEPTCKGVGAQCESSAECCGSNCKLEEIQSEVSGAWSTSGNSYCM